MKSTLKGRLRKSIERLPHSSGVYLMKDKKGAVIYIGKAGQLKKRVCSYFTQRVTSPKIEVLQRKIYSVEYISTPTEVEALLLEANLINAHHPRYNTLLKDDKSFPLLKITAEEYPRVIVTRNKTEKGARYYGPYTDAAVLREAVSLINAIFPIRKCITLPSHPCLYYYLHQCLAPCFKQSVKNEYRRYIKEIESFLRGKKKSFITYLTHRMKEAASALRFEEAEKCKQQIRSLELFSLRTFSRRDPGASISLSGSIELQSILSLRRVPERIVCFDVSNTYGKWAVASKVSYFREMPYKEAYRRYKIKTVKSIDDYAMIREAVRRMIHGLKSGKETFIPDMIIIDGGKGHLAVGRDVLQKEGYDTIPCITLAKQFETVYTVGSNDPVPLVEGSAAHNFLRRIRDEAHRFAIAYHRSMRNKATLLSRLDSIKQIGSVRRARLMQYFDSIDAMRRAPVEEIAAIQGFNQAVARRFIKEINRLKK